MEVPYLPICLGGNWGQSVIFFENGLRAAYLYRLEFELILVKAWSPTVHHLFQNVAKEGEVPTNKPEN